MLVVDRLNTFQHTGRKRHLYAVDIALELLHGCGANDCAGQESPAINISQCQTA